MLNSAIPALVKAMTDKAGITSVIVSKNQSASQHGYEDKKPHSKENAQ